MSEKWLSLLHTLTGRLLEDRFLRQNTAPLFDEMAGEGYAPEEVALGLAWVERFFAGLPPLKAEAWEPFRSTGCRTRSTEELVCVSPSAFGFLLRLESTGAIDGALREEILERALAACDDEISEDEIRQISRFVLESQGRDSSVADPPDIARARQRQRH